MKTGKMTAGIGNFKSMIGAAGKRLQYSIRNDPYIYLTFCEHFIMIGIGKSAPLVIDGEIDRVIFHSMIQFFSASNHNFYSEVIFIKICLQNARQADPEPQTRWQMWRNFS